MEIPMTIVGLSWAYLTVSKCMCAHTHAHTPRASVYLPPIDRRINSAISVTTLQATWIFSFDQVEKN